MRRSLLLYASLLVLFGAGIAVILRVGSNLPAAASPAVPPAATQAADESILENLRHPLSVLLLQVIVIIAASRAAGLIFRRFRQPAVIGEMVAGILLGPSLLGAIFPSAQAFLFPPSAMGSLHLLSQVGVVLFMFVVGTELETGQIREKAHAAVLVSHASIVVPFFLGTAFSLLIYRALAPAGVSFTAFALFTGIAMSITAFPVLARILEERGMTRTQLGSIAIACAAVDDVTAWCLLALVVAIAKAQGLSSAALTVALAAAFTLVMLLSIRPRLPRLMRSAAGAGPPGKELLAVAVAFILASALITETIGIHALFGAFLAGVIMPRDSELRSFLRSRLEAFSSAFLLPLFFAFTGLRTRVGLLGDWSGWLICGAIVLVAIAGKLGAGALAARWTGMSWPDALTLGALMNTRGLMELIALNIGFDLGILSPRMFAMMVLMALATTLMAGPLVDRIAAVARRPARLAAIGGR